MKDYQYQVLRFRREPVTDDLHNLGIVVFEPPTQEMRSQFLPSAKLTGLFKDVDVNDATMVVQYLEKELKLIEQRTIGGAKFTPFKSLSEITLQLIPMDNGPLFFGGTKTVTAENIQEAIKKAAGKYSIPL